MKKLLLPLSFILFAVFSFCSCEDSKLEPNSDEFSVVKPMNKIDTPEKIRYCGEQDDCLWAGQNIDAGYVKIGNDDKYLYITVHSEEGFQNETENIKIDVVTELPTNRPNAGGFPYKTTVSPEEKTSTFQIPLEDIIKGYGTGQCEPYKFYVLVHADVIANGKGETAWGGCNPGAGKAWWFYSEYYTQCCACWCGFGNNYQNPEKEACKSLLFEGKIYYFWSNKHNFNDLNRLKIAGDQGYKISLVVNSSDCNPQDKEGVLTDNLAFIVGAAYINAYEIEGKPYMDIKYVLDDKYKGYNIQLDVYNGADRVPKYSIEEMKIITDDKHMLYQTKLLPGETTFTFTKLPWLTHDDSMDTYISLHAAIGDCPMPSLQNNVSSDK